MTRRVLAPITTALLMACGPDAATTTPADATAATTPEATTTETEEEAKAPTQAERIAAAIAKVEAQAEEDKKRWTPELQAASAKLTAQDFKTLDQGLDAVLASKHRHPDNVVRDSHRRPKETLKFFGLKPNMTVLELDPGGGWYTEVLAPLLAKKGELRINTFDPSGPKDSYTTYLGRRHELLLGQSEAVFGKVKPVVVDPESETLSYGDPGTVDMVLVIRMMHNWHRGGSFDKNLKAAYDALKPGGVLAVVQHRAAEGANPDESVQKGRLDEAWVIKSVEAGGFKLEEKSEINANPRDEKNYEKGVWTLPPSLALGDTDREKYVAVGESDRMTLRFRKPKK